MPETTDTPRPATTGTRPPPPSPPPDRGGAAILLGVLLIGSWSLAGIVALAARTESCGGLQLGYSTGGPPTADELSATATMFVVALLLGLVAPAAGVVRARRLGRSVAGWAALGALPILLTALTLPPVVQASATQRPSDYCIDRGYSGG
jgi:hypothetical protein